MSVLSGRPGSGSVATFLGSFLACVAACTGLCLVVALRSSTAERTMRIGQKPLAWTVALVAVALFVAAMFEVGTSVKVCDRVRLFGNMDWWAHYPWIHRDDNACTVIQAQDRLVMTRFRIGANGKVADLSQGRLEIPPSQPRVRGGVGQDGRIMDVLDIKWNSSQDLTVTCLAEQACKVHDPVATGEAQQPGTVSTYRFLGRLRIRWPEGDQPRIVAASLAGSPVDVVPDPNMAGLAYHLGSFVRTDKYAYLVYDMTGTVYVDGRLVRRPELLANEGQAWPSLLQVYDWSAEGVAKKVFEVILPPTLRIEQMARGLLFSGSIQRVESSEPVVAVVAAMPLDDLEAVKEAFSHGLPKPLHATTDLTKYGRSVPRSCAQWPRQELEDRARGLTFRSESDGIAMTRWGSQFGYRPSLLARAFRGPGGRLTLLDENLLAEVVENRLALYDISDADQIRRVGFYNSTSLGEVIPKAMGSHILVIQADGVVAVLERPKTGKVRPPASQPLGHDSADVETN
jgi:hypothetical protein